MSQEEKSQHVGIRDMTQGSPSRHILIFALPLLAGNVLQQLYTMVDAIVVGQANGANGLAGVSTSSPVVLLLTSFFVGVGLAASVLLSQFYGKGDMDSLRRLTDSIYAILLPMIAVLSVGGILLAGPLLRLTGVPPGPAYDMAYMYMAVIMGGLLSSFGFNLNAGILQGLGNSITPFIFLCISCAINIALDVVFVLVLGWGVTGAAVATVFAQFVSWVLGIFYINRKYTFMHLSVFKFKVDGKLLKRAVGMGLPSGINQSLFAAGSLIMQVLVNYSNDVPFIAGYGAAIRIDAFAFLPIQSICTAVTTFVGQNIGASRISRVRTGLRTGILLSCITTGVVCLLVLPFPTFIISLISSDASVLAPGALYIRQVFPFYWLLSLLYVFGAVLRGAGQNVVPMVATLISLWVVRIPVAYLIQTQFGYDYIYYSNAVAWLIGLVIVGLYYFTGRWTKKHLIEPEASLV